MKKYIVAITAILMIFASTAQAMQWQQSQLNQNSLQYQQSEVSQNSEPSQKTEKTENTVTKFVSIADIHFDPFIGCENESRPCKLILKLSELPGGQWDGAFQKYKAIDNYFSHSNQDTNYLLLASALRELSNINKKEHPKFVLILGDFLAHQYRQKYKYYSKDYSQVGYQNFVRKTFVFLTYKFNQVFPDIDVYPVVGNNDSYSGNYDVKPNGLFFQDLKDIWKNYIKDKHNQVSFENSFPYAGYYSVSINANETNKSTETNKSIAKPEKQHRIIILNTVLFSPNAESAPVTVAADTQLKWLQKQLQIAANNQQQVIIGIHIPIGIDIYSTFKNQIRFIKNFWRDSYSLTFQNILENTHAKISCVLPGHIHMDALQILTLNSINQIPIIFTPSISPIIGNSPSFKIFSYQDPSLQIKSYQVYEFNGENGGTWFKDARRLLDPNSFIRIELADRKIS